MSAGSGTSSPVRSRDVFLSALDKPPGDRAAFLDAACGRDAKLRAEVEELLRENDQMGDFLESPALDQTTSITLEIAPDTLPLMEKAGDRIGRYKLLQKIGEGGGGIVYMAEQEEPVRRRVALKIIKLGMDTKSVIARFEAERQALALMEHPNIARVLDAGATETGRPYFVMELVRGIRITDYCDQNNLTTEGRLKLFVQVCQAIQHAHQKGVIHRDIKPSNILVTLHDGVPVPKVIDFGIAKATEQRLTDKTLFTEFQSFIGTPAYMSPEQAEMIGLDIDTRSDIYALGVLLYEMLTGKTPFDARELMRLGLDGCRRTIREKEPARPSTRLATMVEAELTTMASRRQIEAPKLIHSLRGDLDWIAMKCLEKDRTRRYATANDLAADVHRFLDGDTVLARPPSNVYRLQKFLRRHRGPVAAAAAIAFTLVAGSIISTWQAVRATNAEHAAERSEKLESGLRQRAERESAAARLNEYVADINLAEQSRLAGNYGRAVQLLNKHRPGPGKPDLRGFEWRYLWQLTRGDEHVEFPNQEEPVQSVALSPAGDFLAVGLDRKLNIWNVRKQTLVISLRRGASSLAFLPDGKTLIAADFRGVWLLNTDNWMERQSLPGSSGPIAISSDATRLAAASREGVRIWDTATWKELKLVPNATPPLSLSPDGQRLAADSRAGLSVWNLDEEGANVVLHDSTNLIARSFGFRNDRTLAFSPDGKWILAARNMLSDRGVFVLSIWDARSGEEVAVIPRDPEHIEHTGGITSIVFSPDGRTFATASRDYSIRLWDFEKRQRVTTLHGHLNEVLAIAFSRDGQSIVSGARGGGLKLWPTRVEPREEEFAGARVPIVFSTNSVLLAALSRQNSVVFFNLNTSTAEEEFPLETPRGPGGPGRPMFRAGAPSVAVSADLRTIASAHFDGTVKLLNTVTRESNTLRTAEQFISMLALSPDGRTLVTGGWEDMLHWWDLRRSTNMAVVSDGGRALFSADSRTLAVFNREGGIELWDAASRSLRTNLVAESALALGSSGFPASFSPDGRLLAVACQDDAIRLWEVATAKLIGTLIGHKQSVFTVAFSPDGKTLATASDDSTLKLWNIATQQELFTIRRPGAGLRALTFSPDGRSLVAGTSSTLLTGGLRMFRAPLLSEIDTADSRAALLPPIDR